jgi:phosphohistidine phosphatase
VPSEWKGADAERPLTSEGVKKAKCSAVTIAGLQLELDAIITSPFVRARQTAEIVSQKVDVQMVVDARLGPAFDIERLREILGERPSAGALMLVGHEPGFSETISALIGGGRIACKKGALACVRIDDIASLRGELTCLIPPKVLAL